MADSKLVSEEVRGHNAAMLLDNELLQEAMTAIDKEVMEQCINSPARDKDGKEALWQLIKTSRKFKDILTGYIETGKLATETMKHFEKRSLLRRVLP
jgi:hypothetical protein